jgi:cyclin H
MTEDVAYRASSQFRLWSFTPATLASLRSSTNANAGERVKAAKKRGKVSIKVEHEDEKKAISESEKDIDYLTVEEELKLVGYICVKTMELADHCGFPTNVKVGKQLFHNCL